MSTYDIAGQRIGTVKNPKGLPATVHAKWPVNYEEAKAALAECARIDECKSWADKAEAIRSYAKQADDDRLLAYSKRIKVRAIDRMGELAAEIPAARGANQNIVGGAAPKVQTRKDAARGAGISPDQLKTALRVHNVPRDSFERQVESDDPPTVTELARQGTKSKPPVPDLLKGRDPLDFQAATYILGKLSEAVEYFSKFDVARASRGWNERERRRAIKDARALRDIIDETLAELESS